MSRSEYIEDIIQKQTNFLFRNRNLADKHQKVFRKLVLLSYMCIKVHGVTNKQKVEVTLFSNTLIKDLRQLFPTNPTFPNQECSTGAPEMQSHTNQNFLPYFIKVL